MLEAVQRLIDIGHSWLAECTALFLIPFVHEDVAILGGSLLVIEHRLPVLLALSSLFAGMVASDLALYGLGVLAVRNRFIRDRLASPAIDRLGHWLGGHLPAVMTLARLIPGLMFPVYLTCGAYRVRLVTFATITTVTAAIYLVVVFGVLSAFGTAVLSRIGYWSWIVAIGILLMAVANWSRSPDWRLLLRVSSRGAHAFVDTIAGPAGAGAAVTHRGMPKLDGLPRRVALAERIPVILFYVPLGIQWLWLGLRHGDLSLPALANPNIEAGGLWGESKSSYLDMVAADQRRWLAPYATMRRSRDPGSAQADVTRAQAAMQATGLGFPVVVKPDIGWRGFGVRLVQDAGALATYLAAFPAGEALILQRPVPYDGEAGVLYARLPGEADGRVISLTFRYFPTVVGDGQTMLRDLILRDQRTAWKAGSHFGLESLHSGRSIHDLEHVPAEGEVVRLSFIGSNRVGGLYRDAREHITPALERRFDAISKALPEFYYGRYDIRFRSTDELRDGEAFEIIEVNGAGGESINVWDPKMPLGQVYRELFDQQRLLFEIGRRNRGRGYASVGAWSVLRSQWRQHRLILRYPPSG